MTDAGIGYFERVMQDGPKAYYRLAEAAGPTLIDATGKHNDAYRPTGTTFGVPGALTPPTAAVELDGASGCDAGDVFDFSAVAASFTIEAWVKHPTTGAVESNGSVAPANFVHVAATYDGTRGAVCIDGALAGGPTVMTKPGDSTGLFSIGCQARAGAADTEFWKGPLDEVAVFDKALSESIIKQHYDSR